MFEICVGYVQELFTIVGRLVRAVMDCSVRDTTASTPAVRLIRPSKTDAISQAFSTGSTAVITSWVTTVTTDLPLFKDANGEHIFIRRRGKMGT